MDPVSGDSVAVAVRRRATRIGRAALDFVLWRAAGGWRSEIGQCSEKSSVQMAGRMRLIGRLRSQR
jgi:hypothetical protein